MKTNVRLSGVFTGKHKNGSIIPGQYVTITAIRQPCYYEKCPERIEGLCSGASYCVEENGGNSICSNAITLRKMSSLDYILGLI